MDRLAEKLGMDPLTFRLKNYARKEDGDQDRKIPFASYGMEECVLLGVQSSSAGRPNGKSRARAAGPVKKGLGVAFQSCRHGSITPPMSAIIKLDPDGTVELLNGLNDSGGWQKTTMAIIAAEELGVPFDAVQVTTGDTDSTTDTGGPGGSRGTPATGLAVIAAARDAKNQLLDVAADILKKKKEELEIRDGQIFVSGENRPVPYKDILSKSTTPIIGRGSPKPPQSVATHSFGVHFAEVEVDTRTGKVEVLRLVAAHDVGRAINRLGLKTRYRAGPSWGSASACSKDSTSTVSQVSASTRTWLISRSRLSLMCPWSSRSSLSPTTLSGLSGLRGVASLLTAYRPRPSPMRSIML